jgi:hypothetical protein
MRNDLCFLGQLATRKWRKFDEDDYMTYAGVEGEGWMTTWYMPNGDYVCAVMDKPLEHIKTMPTRIDIMLYNSEYNLKSTTVFTIAMKKI